MPLLDHFHAPLHPRHPWESFHGSWCNALMRGLNQMLSPRYFAAFQVHLGSRVEADVAEFEREGGVAVLGNGHGGAAVATYSPPAATGTVRAEFPDDIEVQVIDTRDGAVLVAVIELVSPRNKDRPEAREAFAAKCAAYLQRGLGVIVLDIVTSRQANLHNHLMSLLRQPSPAAGPPLYTAAYRPVRREGRNEIDVWLAPLTVGEELPTMPLALRGAACVPIELESTYTQARDDSAL